MMIFGSGTELANAAIHDRIMMNINSAATRFMGALSVKDSVAQSARGSRNYAKASIYSGSIKSRAKRIVAAISQRRRRKLRAFAAIVQKSTSELHSFALHPSLSGFCEPSFAVFTMRSVEIRN
jgi:hypothetical protein